MREAVLPDTQKLDALALLLNEMALAKTENVEGKPPRWLAIWEWVSSGAFILATIAFVIMAVHYRRAYDPPLKEIPEALSYLYYAMLLSAFSYMVSVLWAAGRILWRQRRDNFAVSAALCQDMQRDAPYLLRLSEFDKPTLEYGLLQYRCRLSSVDGRLAMLVGDFRKVGLIPGFLAVSLASSTLLKAGSNPFLWVPVILAGCFYLLAFYVIGKRERPDQVIGLLEQAIRYASSPDQTGKA